MRRIYLALVLLLSLALMSTGCVTRSSRDWGYVDRAAVPVAANAVPMQVTPSAIPSGAVAMAPQMQGVVPVQPYSYGNTYPAIPTRQTYEHNHESFNLNDIAPWVFMGIMGTDLILRHTHGHHGRWHRHNRGWYRW